MTYSLPQPRKSEWVIIGFLAYAAVLALLLPVAAPVRNLVAFLNLALLFGYACLLRMDAAGQRLVTSVVRDWLPLAITVLAYREVGWFAMPHHGHALENQWIIWDHAVLRGGAKSVIESFGPVIPSGLEIAYAVVYALAPFSVAAL